LLPLQGGFFLPSLLQGVSPFFDGVVKVPVRRYIGVVINLFRFTPSATLPGPNFLKKFDKTGLDLLRFKKHPILG